LIGSSVSQPDLARMYNAADLTLSTSLGEGWGFSFTEALACGCPLALPMHTSGRELALKLTELEALALRPRHALCHRQRHPAGR
jgi:glycosyltransferase involved in cell wall biosynthesis